MPKRRRSDSVEVKSNLKITVRERGKRVTSREGHNIWLDSGREWMAELICYQGYPSTFQESNRIRFMGFGIGGNRQNALGVANVAPIYPAYPGQNIQHDADPTVTRLERPVRLSGSEFDYANSLLADEWLGEVQAPVFHPTAHQSRFSRLFTETEISYGSFLTVPLSEIMLFTNGLEQIVHLPTGVYNQTGVAYDTFDTISKTQAFSLEVDWTLRF